MDEAADEAAEETSEIAEDVTKATGDTADPVLTAENTAGDTGGSTTDTSDATHCTTTGDFIVVTKCTTDDGTSKGSITITSNTTSVIIAGDIIGDEMDGPAGDEGFPGVVAVPEDDDLAGDEGQGGDGLQDGISAAVEAFIDSVMSQVHNDRLIGGSGGGSNDDGGVGVESIDDSGAGGESNDDGGGGGGGDDNNAGEGSSLSDAINKLVQTIISSTSRESDKNKSRRDSLVHGSGRQFSSATQDISAIIDSFMTKLKRKIMSSIRNDRPTIGRQQDDIRSDNTRRRFSQAIVGAARKAIREEMGSLRRGERPVTREEESEEETGDKQDEENVASSHNKDTREKQHRSSASPVVIRTDTVHITKGKTSSLQMTQRDNYTEVFTMGRSLPQRSGEGSQAAPNSALGEARDLLRYHVARARRSFDTTVGMLADNGSRGKRNSDGGIASSGERTRQQEATVARLPHGSKRWHNRNTVDILSIGDRIREFIQGTVKEYIDAVIASAQNRITETNNDRITDTTTDSTTNTIIPGTKGNTGSSGSNMDTNTINALAHEIIERLSGATDATENSIHQALQSLLESHLDSVSDV
ncbi:hypothetical protein E2C01_034556 [Portunus trituberculatus]|uniref:Uncharacterized protein n=1 Tax=Portunus trituberculatus TaxID=210409 RepID=A0A5B7F797_PORTR|nr:hypothetical protein [Portunus trituberculatus]